MFVVSPKSSACLFWTACASSLAHKHIKENTLQFANSASILYEFNSVINTCVPKDTGNWHNQLIVHPRIVVIESHLPYINMSNLSAVEAEDQLVAPAHIKQSDLSSQMKISNYINKYHRSMLKPFVCIYVPALSIGGGPLKLMAWLVNNESYVHQGQWIARIWLEDKNDFKVLRANDSGLIYQSVKVGYIVNVGEAIGSIVLCDDPLGTQPKSGTGSDSALALSVQSTSTANAIQKGNVQVASGSIPRFMPSSACEPAGFQPMETAEADLKFALANCKISFQSFFNELEVLTPHGVNEDVVSIASFDEALYCALVREMHRYSLAEIADNQSDLAKKNAGLGAMVGSLIGLISGNIFAPFLGHSYGKSISDRGKRVEEFLPDPNLLFYQDENSYLSWSKAQVVSPRLRRLILERRVKPDGNVFFRLVPAIVTADSVFPIQLFKVDSSTYFYRPLSAGIDRYQANYDAIKVQKRYFHLRGEGAVAETGIVIPVSGQDIEDYDCRIYRFTCSYLDYFYVDFKIQPGSVF
jgi:hypothetical protein